MRVYTRIASLLVAATCAHATALMEFHELARRASAGSPNVSLVETARMSLMSSQRAAWEQGTAQAALLEYDAGGWSVFAGGQDGRGPPYRPGFQQSQWATAPPMNVLSMAYHSATAQDGMGKLGSTVTGDEDEDDGPALDSASCGEGECDCGHGRT